jgi:hypothetical protein
MENKIQNLPNEIQWHIMKFTRHPVADVFRAVVLNSFVDALKMKRFSIGALDLQSSGGRILYEKRKVVAGLNPKSLEDMLKDYLKSEDEAKKIVEFIKENRETRVKESLKYETE